MSTNIFIFSKLYAHPGDTGVTFCPCKQSPKTRSRKPGMVFLRIFPSFFCLGLRSPFGWFGLNRAGDRV